MNCPRSRSALALLLLSVLSRPALADDALEEEAEYLETEDVPEVYFDARYVRATVVGGTLLKGGSPANAGTRIAADRVMNSDESSILVKNAYRFTGNRLEHSWTYAPDAWATEDLGGCFTSSAASVSWGPGRVDLFARGCDNAIYHLWNDGSGWKPAWGNWEYMGGAFISGPAVGSYQPNSLQLVGVGNDRAVYIKVWNGSYWSGWLSLGGQAYSDPSIVSWGDGRLDVVYKGGDNNIYLNALESYSVWTGWTNIGAPPGGAVGGPSIASRAFGKLDVFVRGTDGHVWMRSYKNHVITWSDWVRLDLRSDGDPHAVAASTDMVDVYVLQGQQPYHYNVLVGDSCKTFTARWGRYHGTGRWDGQNRAWSARTDLDGANHLSFGPYIEDMPPGRFNVFWTTLVDNNTADNGPIVTHDIWDANTGATHAAQTLTRLQFAYKWTYKYSMLGFVSSPGQKMEFRTYWHDTSYVRENNLEVCGNWQVPNGDVLLPGQQWTSNNGLARLVHQNDGNVVLYAHTGQVLWATNTYGRATSRFIFQPDGNLVLYDSNGAAIWANYVFGGSYLTVQDDCNVVVYNTSNQALWSTQTGCPR